MSKTAILTDSNCGIGQQEARELGIYVLPTPFYIDDKMYLEGVDLSEDDFFKLQTEGHEIHTSTPLMGDLLSKWDELLEDYEELVYIPLSSGLSSSCMSATAESTEDKYDGRVFVVNNQRISVTMKLSVLEAKRLCDDGRSAAEIKEYLEEHKAESSIYIMVNTLEYLKKGGRVTPAVAAIGSLLRIKPVLLIRGDKLDSFAKARTLKHARQIMSDAIENDLNSWLEDPGAENSVISIAHSANEEAALTFRDELAARYPGKKIEIDKLPLVILCHIGPGALAVTATRSFLQTI